MSNDTQIYSQPERLPIQRTTVGEIAPGLEYLPSTHDSNFEILAAPCSAVTERAAVEYPVSIRSPEDAFKWASIVSGVAPGQLLPHVLDRLSVDSYDPRYLVEKLVYRCVLEVGEERIRMGPHGIYRVTHYGEEKLRHEIRIKMSTYGVASSIKVGLGQYYEWRDNVVDFLNQRYLEKSQRLNFHVLDRGGAFRSFTATIIDAHHGDLYETLWSLRIDAKGIKDVNKYRIYKDDLIGLLELIDHEIHRRNLEEYYHNSMVEESDLAIIWNLKYQLQSPFLQETIWKLLAAELSKRSMRNGYPPRAFIPFEYSHRKPAALLYINPLPGELPDIATSGVSLSVRIPYARLSDGKVAYSSVQLPTYDPYLTLAGWKRQISASVQSRKPYGHELRRGG